MEKKRGRPPKAAGQARSKPLQIRADAAEKEAFNAAAELAGASFSTWARERLRAAARKELQEAGQNVAFLASNRPKRSI